MILCVIGISSMPLDYANLSVSLPSKVSLGGLLTLFFLYISAGQNEL